MQVRVRAEADEPSELSGEPGPKQARRRRSRSAPIPIPASAVATKCPLIAFAKPVPVLVNCPSRDWRVAKIAVPVRYPDANLFEVVMPAGIKCRRGSHVPPLPLMRGRILTRNSMTVSCSAHPASARGSARYRDCKCFTHNLPSNIEVSGRLYRPDASPIQTLPHGECCPVSDENILNRHIAL